jgi:hypothetical protein
MSATWQQATYRSGERVSIAGRAASDIEVEGHPP